MQLHEGSRPSAATGMWVCRWCRESGALLIKLVVYLGRSQAYLSRQVLSRYLAASRVYQFILRTRLGIRANDIANCRHAGDLALSS